MDIEKMLEEGDVIRIKPQGWSMYPLIVYGRDYVIIEPADQLKLKRGDVVLYHRDKSILVIHRIFKITEAGFYLVGDNQVEIEGPLRPDQIKGKMISFIRNDKEISVNNFWYILYSKAWLLLRPCRPWISKLIHAMKKA